MNSDVLLSETTRSFKFKTLLTFLTYKDINQNWLKSRVYQNGNKNVNGREKIDISIRST